MNIKIKIEHLDDDEIEKFQEKAADLLSSILIKKLRPKDIDKLVNILNDDLKKLIGRHC